MMVAFLVGVVALILVRTLRNDYSKVRPHTDKLCLGDWRESPHHPHRN